MVARRIGAALAITAMMVPVAAQAADVAIGTVASGTSALVARDGKVMPAVAGMKLYPGDRVITRAGGSANVTMAANNCAVTVGASAMLPMAGATCAKPNTIAFDEGRAGYDGRSSAFQDGHHPGPWFWGVAFFGALSITLYEILHNPRGGHINFPPPPVSP
jgi:hypothetical protein